MKINKIEAIIALDDLDVEKQLFSCKTSEIAGMGQTTGRFFRDKTSHANQSAGFWH